MRYYITSEHNFVIIVALTFVFILFFTKKVYKTKWISLILIILSGINYFTFSSNNILGRICMDKDENLYVVADAMIDISKYELLLMKFNSNGKKIWSKQVNWFGKKAANISAFMADDLGYVYLIATGKLIKIDSEGNKLWAKKIPKSVYYATIKDDTIIIAGVSNENIITMGIQTNGLVKKSKVMQEKVKFDYTTEPLCVDIQENLVFFSKNDTSLVKANSDGQRIWKIRISQDEVPKIVTDRDGNIYYITNINEKAALVKVDQSGKELWTRTFSMGQSTEYTMASDMFITQDNHLVLTGEYTIYTGKTTGTIRYENAFLIKYNLSGDEIWRNKIKVNPYTNEQGRLICDEKNNTYLALDNPWSSKDIYLRKVNPEGKKLWESTSYKPSYLWPLLIVVWSACVGIKDKWSKWREKKQKEMEAYFQR